MIYFICTAICILGFFAYLSDFSAKYGHAKTAFAAVFSLIVYIGSKGLAFRLRHSIGEAWYKVFSIFVVPIYSLSIISYSKHMDHIKFWEHPLLLFACLLIMADTLEFNTRYLKNSGIFSRQKDSVFMPPKDYKGPATVYFLKYIGFYVLIALVGDKLSLL